MENIKKRKKLKISKVILFCFLFVILFQVSIFYVCFKLLNTSGNLEKSAYARVYNRAKDRAERIENMLNYNWSNTVHMKNLSDFTKDMYIKSLNKKTKINLDLNAARYLLNTIDSMMVSGAFIVLPTYTDSKTFDNILYMRDTDMSVHSMNMYDIELHVGNEKIADQMNIMYNGRNTKNFHLIRDISSDFNETVLSDISRHNIKGGIWYTSEQLFSDKDDSNMYFVTPIFNEYTLELYGVVGIAVDINKQILPLLDTNELSASGKKSAYLFTKNINSSSSYVLAASDCWEKIKNNDTLSYNTIDNKYYQEDSMEKYIKQVPDIKISDNVQVMSMKIPINLQHNSEKIFENKLYLIPIFEKNEIVSQSKTLQENMIIAAIFSIILGVVLSSIVSIRITDPIKSISKQLEETTDFNNISIKKQNIEEYDKLIDIFESLSLKLKKRSTKFQSIIDYSSISMVAVEINEKEKTIHKLGKISRILTGYKNDEPFYEIFKLDDVHNVHNMFGESKVVESRHSERNDVDIDIIEKIWKGNKRYIKVVTKNINESYINDDIESSDNEITLKIITDYTKDMLEKYKILNERNFDTLTGLLNRTKFRESVQNYISRSLRKGKKAAMIMLDIDDLKYINDTYGHECGDKCIKVAGGIIGTLQDENNFVARLSGDEFFAFLEYKNDKNEIIRKIEDIIEKLYNANIGFNTIEDIKIRVTIGIAWYPDDSPTYEDLIKYSDFAMYQAKNSKKGTIEYFNKEIYDKDYILFSGKEHFNKFIEERQVRFAFQPIVDAKTGEIYSYEALMRPTSPNINGVYDVMRLAKAQSKLGDIETLTWIGVLETVNFLYKELGDKKIFINSFPNYMVDAVTFDESVLKYSHLFKKLVVEIVEQEEIDDKCMLAKQNFRKKYGSKMAIDDFGSGYANEALILQINPDFIKIDMELTRNIDTDESKQAIVENIVRYAHAQNIKIICEGVETHTQLEKLISIGTDYVQGFYIKRPDFEITDIDSDIKSEIIKLATKYRGKSA